MAWHVEAWSSITEHAWMWQGAAWHDKACPGTMQPHGNGHGMATAQTGRSMFGLERLDRRQHAARLTLSGPHQRILRAEEHCLGAGGHEGLANLLRQRGGGGRQAACWQLARHGMQRPTQRRVLHGTPRYRHACFGKCTLAHTCQRCSGRPLPPARSVRSCPRR